METITIFHTNDVHSGLTYWERTQAFIKAQRQRIAAAGETSFLCDLGDHLDRSSVFTEASLGMGNIRLLNEAQYDVVTIGNNEGITLGHEDVNHLYDNANFDVVVANLKNMTDTASEWLKPYVIKETVKGTKIAFIGATAPFDIFYKELGWQVEEPKAALVRVALYLRPQVDIIICLSHLGKTEDELLAEMCPQIDVIFGAHTHHVWPHGKKVNGVLLTGGGMLGKFVGELTIKYEKSSGTIVSKSDILYECATLPVIIGEEERLQQLIMRAESAMQQVAFTAPMYFNKEWYHYSNLSHFFAQAILHKTAADCALFNAGIFLQPLNKGPITALDMHRALPHPINLCVIEVPATELKEILLESLNEDWPRMALKGLGFRGVVLGKILTYGLALDCERKLKINGQYADMTKSYKLVTLDLFTFGYFYPRFKYAKKHYILPEFIRDILLDYGKEIYPNSP